MKYSFLICLTKIGSVEERALSSVFTLVNEYNKNNKTKAEVVIVVNGHNPNETAAQLESIFLYDFVKVLTSEIRQLTSNLNFGLNFSKGEYIVRFDSDDICLPNRLELIDKILDCESVKPDLIAGSALYVDNEKVELKKPLPLNHVLKAKSPFIHPALTIKRKTLIDLGGYMGFQYAQDYELALRCFYNDCSYVIDKQPHIKYICSESQVYKRILSYSMQLSYIYQRLLIKFDIQLLFFFIIKQLNFIALKIVRFINGH